MKGAAVMLNYRRIAFWVAMLVVPGGIFVLLAVTFADILKHRKAQKTANAPFGDNPKTPNDPGSTPRTPDGTTPRLAA